MVGGVRHKDGVPAGADARDEAILGSADGPVHQIEICSARTRQGVQRPTGAQTTNALVPTLGCAVEEQAEQEKALSLSAHTSS